MLILKFNFIKFLFLFFQEYMLCKSELRDPRKCLKEGKEVTACGLKFYEKIKSTCKDELETLAKCSEWNSSDYQLK